MLSCKKQETLSYSFESLEQLNGLPSTENPTFISVSNALKREEKRSHFFCKFSKIEGLLNWDGALVKTNVNSRNILSSTIVLDKIDTTVLVPLVLLGTKFVNSFLICNLNQGDYTFHLVNRRNYKSYGYNNNNNLNADFIAKLFMLLEYTTFNHDSFLITDMKLIKEFPQNLKTKPYTIKIHSPIGNAYAAMAALIPIQCDGYWLSINNGTASCIQTTPWNFGGAEGGGGSGGNGSGNGGNGSGIIGSGGNGSGSGATTDPYSSCSTAIIQGNLIQCPPLNGNNIPPGWASTDTPPFNWVFQGNDRSIFKDNNPTIQPSFKLDITDRYEILYPRFTNMVKNLKTFVKANPVVLAALQKYSGFTKQQIIDKLTFGKGPTIKFSEMVGTYGFYNAKTTGPNILNVRASYVRGLEKSFFPSTQQATAFLLAVSLLHEFVHYSTTTNHISEGAFDFGYGFERDAFNVYVEDNNAANVMVKFKRLP